MSGGIDSTALLNYFLNLQYHVKGVYINYGHPANLLEYQSVKKLSKHFKIKVKKIDIDFQKKISSGKIVGRNLMLISNAIMYYPNKTGIIAIGIHAGTSYEDCTKNFLTTMDGLLDLYTDGKIQLEAPFIAMNKQEIWQYCLDNNVPLELTYSCENGLQPGCGKCLSCQDKESLYELSKK